MDAPNTPATNPTAFEKRVNRVQRRAAALVITGLLCGLVPLAIYFEKYLTVRTVTDRLLLIDYHECPTIMLGVVLIYLGIIMAQRRSRVWFTGIASFILVATPTVLVSAMNLMTTGFCIVFLLFTVIGFPRDRLYHYAFPVFALVAGAILTPTIGWASIRGYVSKTHAEIRIVAESLQNYHAAHHAYPPSTFDPALRADWNSNSPMPGFEAHRPNSPAGLTTPIAYMDHFFPDDFRLLDEKRTYSYYRWDENTCILIGAGPNCVFDIKPLNLPRMKPVNGATPPELINLAYDPTNGTISPGDIFRIVTP